MDWEKQEAEEISIMLVVKSLIYTIKVTWTLFLVWVFLRITGIL